MMGTGSIAAIMTGTGRQSCCHHDGLIFGVRAGASNVSVAIVLFSSWFFLCVFMCLLGYLFVPGAGCVLFDFLCYVASVVLVFVLIF